jgi:hypothetical protein
MGGKAFRSFFFINVTLLFNPSLQIGLLHEGEGRQAARG